MINVVHFIEKILYSEFEAYRGGCPVLVLGQTCMFAMWLWSGLCMHNSTPRTFIAP